MGIVKIPLRITDVRLIGINGFRLVVLGAFAIGITMVRRWSPGICFIVITAVSGVQRLTQVIGFTILSQARTK